MVATALIWNTNWPTLYINTQFHLHRSEFAALATHFNSAHDDTVALPLDMRYLSLDGHAHRRDAALYIPLWQNWRAEDGFGLAYFPGDTATEAIIATADGDMGTPMRYLGDGWWLVD